jgi:Uma2 family endonuclease
VLSPATSGYEVGPKFHFYRQLSSLKEYILISSTSLMVNQFYKTRVNEWRFTGHTSRSLVLPAIHASLPLSELYRNVDFKHSE